MRVLRRKSTPLNKDEGTKLRPFVTVETFLIGDCRSLQGERARANVLSHATWITLKGHPAAFDARVHRGITRENSLGTRNSAKTETATDQNPRLFLSRNFAGEYFVQFLGKERRGFFKFSKYVIVTDEKFYVFGKYSVVLR